MCLDTWSPDVCPIALQLNAIALNNNCDKPGWGEHWHYYSQWNFLIANLKIIVSRKSQKGIKINDQYKVLFNGNVPKN